MTITLKLPEPVERKLAERAAKEGKAPETLAIEMIERELATPQTFDQILAPFRQSVAESGVTDEELDALVEEAREEIYQEKHGKKK